MKRIICLLFLLFLFPINTNALYDDVIDSRCTTSLKASLKEKAKDILYRVSKSDEEPVTYSVILYNTSGDLKVVDGDGNIYTDKISNLKPGSKLVLNFMVSDNNYCSGYKAGSRIINIPYYNKYSTYDICIGYESYYLCNENSNINYTEDEFLSRMNDYIDSLNKKEIIVDPIHEDEEVSILSFIIDNYIYMLGVLGIISVIVIASVIESKRKNKGIL